MEEIVNIDKIIEKQKSIFVRKDISLISQNCIGGIIYHDMNMKFLSPTINLYFDSKDFIKFVNNIDYYLSKDMIFLNTQIVTGIIEDIKIYFLHYSTKEEAIEKWNERKKRIINNKIFIIQTDRDGFDEEDFENFKNIKYPKALITRNKDWEKYDFVIYLDKYKNEKTIPDTIPKREFYKNDKIIKLINQV
ncbi:MAG: DUF1919 domain-containing protein [Candidatus Scatovivens sp.]